MPNMKKKACDGSNSDNGGGAGDLKQKERHMVSWSKEEDDILREQIGIHGTNNWAVIASKFENKTTRQCRRRWFTYLNSDFKKGGWSPEEDMLLCEAQKIYGNRWTEIAKVVSGRTDNAVKNRFSVLCKKRAKHEASTKENNPTADMNINKKRKENTYGILETSTHPMKTRRKHIASTTEDCNLEEQLVEESRTTSTTQQRRPPFAVLEQNCHNTNFSTALIHADTKKAPIDASDGSVAEGIFLKKDNPKIVDGKGIGEYDAATSQDILPPCYELKNDAGGVCPLPNLEFNSPVQVTPLFRSMAQGIPSPQFSESERSFLLRTLGMESTPPNATTGTSQSPSCKKTLLNCL